MTTVYIVFGIIFAVLIAGAIVIGICDVRLISARKKAAANKRKTVPLEIRSNDLILRIKDGDIQTYDAPPEELREETAPPVEEEPVRDEEPEGENLVEVPEGSVVLMRGEKQTFAEKYAELPEENRRLLDEFAAYVVGKEDCGKQLQMSSLMFKYRRSQIVKAVIRRDAALLQFSIVNPDFGRMVRQEKTEGLKVRPVVIRLSSEDDLEAAKQTTDITLAYVRGEEEYKQEKRREARREAARLRREEELKAESAAVSEEPASE